MAWMDPTPAPPRRRKRPSAGYAIGAFVVEIDQRLLRNQPPVEELVAKGAPVRGLSSEPAVVDLGRITVALPPPVEAETAVTAEDPGRRPTRRPGRARLRTAVTSEPDAARRPASAAPSPAPAGRVLHIHIAAAAGAPMQAVDQVEARAGGGLAGDRYDSRTGHWSPIKRRGDWLSLIEQEEIDRLATSWGLALAPGETRRNITTRGIRLDSLLGRRFQIGAVTCFAVRHCEPCTYLEQLLGREIIYPLVHRAGIRVEILEGGVIAVGDEVAPLGT